jgi:hypothetical protein
VSNGKEVAMNVSRVRSTTIVIVGYSKVERNPMPSKLRKPKPFSTASAVKAAAREKIGAPPPTRAEPAEKKHKGKGEKHKKTLGEILSGEE